MDDALRDKLRCIVCRRGLREEQGELCCEGCGARYARPGGPPALLLAAAAEARTPAWRRWRQAEDLLDRWRRSRPAPARQGDAARLRRFLSFFAPRGDLLDIGSKDGHLAPLLPEAVRYFGIDPFPSPEAHPHVVRAVGERLPFADQSFDCVVYCSSFDYLVDPDAALQEAARVLRPGGRVGLVQTVHPAPVASLLRAQGAGSLVAAADPRAWMSLGARQVARELFTGALKLPRAHASYYARHELEAILSSRFVLEARAADPGEVIFLSARHKGVSP